MIIYSTVLEIGSHIRNVLLEQKFCFLDFVIIHCSNQVKVSKGQILHDQALISWVDKGHLLIFFQQLRSNLYLCILVYNFPKVSQFSDFLHLFFIHHAMSLVLLKLVVCLVQTLVDVLYNLIGIINPPSVPLM